MFLKASEYMLIACYASAAFVQAERLDTLDKRVSDNISILSASEDVSLDFVHANCRRDPTWKKVNHDECQKIMGWKPRDQWWRQDTFANSQWLGDNGPHIEQCLQDAFESAEKANILPRCEMNITHQKCKVLPTKVRGQYIRGEYDDENVEELVILSDAFTEQEAFAVEALEKCTRTIFHDSELFYEAREFGEEVFETPSSNNNNNNINNPSAENNSTEFLGMYKEFGGNYVTFLNGLAEMYIPGVIATTYRVLQVAYDKNRWGERQGMPSPHTLGVHSAEFLRYETNGRLGVHADKETVYTITVALSNFGSYEGGYFHMGTREAYFKVPRRSAIVFFGESLHGVTDIVKGERTLFAMEVWEDDDVPIGLPRPELVDFAEYKQERKRALDLDLSERNNCGPHESLAST